MATRNSLTASSEIGCVPDEPPGVPELSSPNASLSAAPSTWMLLYRLDVPPTEVPASLPLPTWENWGVRRVKSVRLREIVGSRWISSSDTLVPVPMFDDEMIAFDWPTTTASPIVAFCEASWTSTCSFSLSSSVMSVIWRVV